MKKTLLLLTPQQISAWSWQAGALSPPINFTDDESGRQAFSEYLDRHRLPIWLLVDLAEESFRYEVLPHINDLDHAHLAQRRLQEYYPDTPLRMVIRQFRHPQVGKDDEMLYSALARPERLAPWLEIMQRRHCLLAAIHSIPHLSAQLLAGIEEEHLLLLSSLASSGIRSSYFCKHRLRYSRLDAQGSLAATLSECWQMREFLRQRRLLPYNATLKLAVLCSQDDWQAAQSSLPPGFDITHFDITTAAATLGCPIAPQGSDAAPLFLHLLANRPPEKHYAPDDFTRRYRQRNLRRALYTLSGLAAFSGFAWSGVTLWQSGQLENDRASLVRQIQSLEFETKKLNPDALPASAPMLLASIQSLQALDSPPPELWLEPIAATLDRHPDIHVEKLDWQSVEENGEVRTTLLMQFSLTQDDSGQLEPFRQALLAQGYLVVSLKSADSPLAPALWQIRKEPSE